MTRMVPPSQSNELRNYVITPSSSSSRQQIDNLLAMKHSNDIEAVFGEEPSLKKRAKRSIVSSRENSIEDLIGSADSTCDAEDINNGNLDRIHNPSQADSGAIPVADYSSLGNAPFPKQYESQFLSATFELGLKNASPKLILPLLPPTTELNTEHIKSHLQKYRVHKERSKEEFVAFYNEHIKHRFDDWNERRAWEDGNFDGNCAGILESKALVEDDKAEKSSNNGSLKAEHLAFPQYPYLHSQSPNAPSYEDLEDKMKELNRLQRLFSDSSGQVENWVKACVETEEQTRILLGELSRARSSVSSSSAKAEK